MTYGRWRLEQTATPRPPVLKCFTALGRSREGTLGEGQGGRQDTTVVLAGLPSGGSERPPAPANSLPEPSGLSSTSRTQRRPLPWGAALLDRHAPHFSTAVSTPGCDAFLCLKEQAGFSVVECEACTSELGAC